ncbi:MAG: aldo/keto reductase [Muribaculaceae bacterium]|nr:aldo/keto reductase [Muribaculaceae bacterium]
MDIITLNNGVEMPQIGLGTFLIPQDTIGETIRTAYDLGYRKFDTAWRYHNEKEIASALKQYGIKREEVFITTKVNADALFFKRYHGGPLKILNIPRRTIRQAVELSFKNLGFEYIDMFLVHTPWPMYPKMYEVLTEFYKAGRIRAIGVSSFLPPMIESLQDVSDVVPAVNQFEISPLNTQKKLIKYCQDKGIAVEAMSTFSHFRSIEPRPEIIENETILPIARKYGKTIPQIILRWLIQQNIAIIPKTWNPKHLKENIEILDFSLSEEDMKVIDSLDRNKFLNYNPYPLLKNVPKKYQGWNGF